MRKGDGPDAATEGMVRVPFDAFLEVGLRLPRLRAVPPLDGRGTGFPPQALLPALGGLHGGPSFCRAFAGWHPDGLALAFEVDSGSAPFGAEEAPYRSDGAEVWIDTRDSRDARRLTPYCHHLVVNMDAWAGPILSVFEQVAATRWSPALDLAEGTVRLGGIASRSGYRLEVFLPAEVLHGYAPSEARSIGLAYRVRVPHGPIQDLAFGESFPLWRNPSLWRSARLEGA